MKCLVLVYLHFVLMNRRRKEDMLLLLGETSNYFPELTTDETKLMAQIKEDPSKYADFIIANGYTGFITSNNVADIIGTIMVSICTSKATKKIIFGSLSPMYFDKGSSN